MVRLEFLRLKPQLWGSCLQGYVGPSGARLLASGIGGVREVEDYFHPEGLLWKVYELT